MKKKKFLQIILIVLLISSGLLFLLVNKKGDLPVLPVKEDYTFNEIISAVSNNFNKIKTIRMDFSDTWYNKVGVDNNLESVITSSEIKNILSGEAFKIKSKGVEVAFHSNIGIIGNYKNKNYKYNYLHLVNWYRIVYEMVLLFPEDIKIDEMIKDRTFHLKKMKKKGYYLISFMPKNNDLYIDLTVRMPYGVVVGINIIENLQAKDENDQEIYHTYMVNAELKDVTMVDDIFIPGSINVRYITHEDQYLFFTKIKKIKFNKKLDKNSLILRRKRGVWYSDPCWVDDSALVVIKGEGQRIADSFGYEGVINKSFTIVKKNIKNADEVPLKHLLFSKDEDHLTRFIFSGDYNKKYNKLAYSVTPAPNNENSALKKIRGVYLLDLNNTENEIRISDTGFSPAWSGSEELLIFNEPDDQKGINNILICNKDGRAKKMIIKNGYNYNWGKNDDTIVFEKGKWIYPQGYISKSRTGLDAEEGIYLYNREEGSEILLNDSGVNPSLSQNKEKMIFSDKNTKKGLFFLNLTNADLQEVSEIEDKDVALKADWLTDNDIILVKTSGSNLYQFGLYKYSLDSNAFEFLSDEVWLWGKNISYLKPSRNQKNLLFKFYRSSDVYYNAWGIFNFKKKNIILERDSIL
ncbi:MAG: hypothetical protein KKH98_07975 [Spirochaetes bacterium]|nr:hypothetical protein [Spirochaetota bacterium]